MSNPIPHYRQDAPHYLPYPYVQPRNGLGTAALVLGIIGAVVFLVPFLAWILGVLSLIFGCIGMSRVNRNIATNGGAAVAGIVLGVVSLVLGTVAFAAYYESADSYSDCVDRADTYRELSYC
jgi:hypothetical protein